MSVDMKRMTVLLTAFAVVFVIAACGRQTADAPTEAPAVPVTEPETGAQPAQPEGAAAVYAAFLGQYEGFSEMEGSLYVQDVNGDGYPEIFARPAMRDADGELYDGAAQFMATYTDQGGLSVIYPNAHSSMGVHFRASADNCLYYTDDGHNVGTSAHHVGFVYRVDSTGFSLMGQAFGEEWELPEDADLNDMELVKELDEKYDALFSEKIRAITGDKTFTDCAAEMPEDPDAVLNEALQIDLAAARQSYTDARAQLKEAVTRIAGKEPQNVFVSDYDRDGAYEAFAFFAEEEVSDALSAGAVWFVNAQGEASPVQTNVVSTDELGVLSCTYHDYFQAPLYGGSSVPTSVWEVRDGACSKVELFDMGQAELEIVSPAYNEFLLPDTLISAQSAFDMSFTDEQINEETGEPFGVGHTHKPYFFRDTPDGIREYGGTAVQQSELETIPGGKELIALAQKDGKTIDSIYYRENGVVSISMRRQEAGETAYSYCNALYADGSLLPLDAEYLTPVAAGDEDRCVMDGFYHAAASPDNATYPDRMG